MSDSRVIKEIYLDTETFQIRSYKNTTFYDLSPDMSLYRGAQVLFRCHLMRSDASTYFLPPTGCTWLFGVDSVFTRDHDDLVRSLDDQFCIEGDWDNLSEAAGKITWRADFTTTALKNDLADLENKTMYAGLWMCPNGGSYTLMAQWKVLMKNIAVDPTTATELEAITYPTMDVLNAAIANITDPVDGLYRIRNGAFQLKNTTTNKFQTATTSGTAGTETMDYGPQED